MITNIARKNDAPAPLERGPRGKAPWQCGYCKFLGAACEGPTVRLRAVWKTTAYILRVNIHRHPTTKGQRAMLIAQLYPDGGKGKHEDDPARKPAETERRIQEARYALCCACDLANIKVAPCNPIGYISGWLDRSNTGA